MKFEPFALERFQSTWENRVAWNVAESGVHPLRVSEVADTQEFRDAVLEQELGYPQTNGTAPLRDAIASMYPGATIDHVQVTNGGSEANCVVMMRLVEPGDELVVMSPNYMQVAGLGRALAATVKPWRVAAESAEHAETMYRWDLDELTRLVTPKTRVICLCNPNNPTGARLDDATLDGVCRIAAHDTPSIWGRGYDRVVVTSGLSKAYGLPGLRIGWIVAPPDLVADTWGIHDYTTIAPGAINDRVARVALAPRQRAKLLARTRMIIRTNYPIVKRWVEKQDGLTHIAPEAGAIVFVRHAHPFRSSELTERLRQERSVLVVPGDFFGMDGHLRIGFGSDPRYLESALTLVGEFLASAGARAR
jgi:hypothetical protein